MLKYSMGCFRIVVTTFMSVWGVKCKLSIFLIDNGYHFTSSLEVYCNIKVFDSGCTGVIQRHLLELFPLS